MFLGIQKVLLGPLQSIRAGWRPIKSHKDVIFGVFWLFRHIADILGVFGVRDRRAWLFHDLSQALGLCAHPIGQPSLITGLL